jgi:MFS family permease
MLLGVFNIFLLGWFFVDVGNFIILPVVGPVVREMGIGELQAGAIVSLSPFVVTLVSPFWGHRTDVWGHRLVFVVGLVGIGVGVGLFGFVVQLGLANTLSIPLLTGLLLAARLLGSFTKPAVWVPPIAYVGNTYAGAERTSKMGLLNAASSLGMVVGPAIVAATARIGIIAPFILAAALPLVPAALGWRRMQDGKRVTGSGAPHWLSPFDVRVWPFLAMGLAVMFSWSLITMDAGFYFQDRLGLSTQATAQLIGSAFGAFGLAMLVAQVSVVRLPKWSPVQLLTAGQLISFVGFVVFYNAGSSITMTLALVVMGCGLGLALTGFLTATTLVVEVKEQGSVAGLINAASGLAFAIGPLLGAALYKADVDYPLFCCAALLGMGLLLSRLHPGVSRVVWDDR